jgi:hypothetical protein
MKKWFKRKKDKTANAQQGGGASSSHQQQQQQQQRRRASAHQPSDSGSEYTDDGDEPVHDFEIAQEDYLVSVALATSANEYQRNGGGAGGGFPLAMGAAGALELSKKYWATCRYALCLRAGARAARHAHAHAAHAIMRGRHAERVHATSPNRLAPTSPPLTPPTPEMQAQHPRPPLRRLLRRVGRLPRDRGARRVPHDRGAAARAAV